MAVFLSFQSKEHDSLLLLPDIFAAADSGTSRSRTEPRTAATVVCVVETKRNARNDQVRCTAVAINKRNTKRIWQRGRAGARALPRRADLSRGRNGGRGGGEDQISSPKKTHKEGRSFFQALRRKLHWLLLKAAPRPSRHKFHPVERHVSTDSGEAARGRSFTPPSRRPGTGFWAECIPNGR
jgi:hypothetical protein